MKALSVVGTALVAVASLAAGKSEDKANEDGHVMAKIEDMKTNDEKCKDLPGRDPNFRVRDPREYLEYKRKRYEERTKRLEEKRLEEAETRA